MAELLFTCPTTQQHAPTGIKTDAQSLRAVWKSKLRVHCLYCGEDHEISVRDTYLDSALDAAADRVGWAA
jgi:hypothetical protein